MRVLSKCSTRHRKTDRGIENRAGHRGPVSAVTVKSAPGSAFSSLPFVHFTLFLFSFKWGHCKTWIACYPSEPFISGVLLKSLEVCWKNRTPHKTLKKASCFNIHRGNWIRLLVKRALVLDLETMNGTDKVQDHLFAFFRWFRNPLLKDALYSRLFPEKKKHKQCVVVTHYSAVWLLNWA